MERVAIARHTYNTEKKVKYEMEWGEGFNWEIIRWQRRSEGHSEFAVKYLLCLTIMRETDAGPCHATLLFVYMSCEESRTIISA